MKTGHSPSYLVKNPYSYCFRIKVPKNLQTITSRKELRYSLGTGILSDAKIKARFLAGQFQLLFKKIQHMNLTKEQINQLINSHKKRIFEGYDRPTMYGQYDDLTPMEKQNFRKNEAQWSYGYKGWLLDTIFSGNYSDKKIQSWDANEEALSVEQAADKILREHGINPDNIQKKTLEYSYLCKKLIQAEIAGIDYYIKQLNGEVIEEQDKFPEATTQDPVDSGPLLSEVMEKFEQAQTKWKPATRKEFWSAMKVTHKILGDIPIGSINRSTMVKYRETLLKAPTYWSTRHKNVEVKDLPIPGVETLASDTIEKHMSFVGPLMEYAVDRFPEYLKDSPMPRSRMSLPDNKTTVKPFTDDQIKTIMDATRSFNDHRYWIPRLGYYTGCRINELCQLHTDDLKERDGIWHLDINNQGKKTLKNKASKRLIPLHPALIETGFIEYVQSVDHHRIFPGCKYRPGAGNYSNNFGNWMRRILIESGIKNKGDRSITFHSFRHGFITVLKRLKLDRTFVQQLSGHSMTGTADREYFEGHLLKDLMETISQIPNHRTI